MHTTFIMIRVSIQIIANFVLFFLSDLCKAVAWILWSMLVYLASSNIFSFTLTESICRRFIYTLVIDNGSRASLLIEFIVFVLFVVEYEFCRLHEYWLLLEHALTCHVRVRMALLDLNVLHFNLATIDQIVDITFQMVLVFYSLFFTITNLLLFKRYIDFVYNSLININRFIWFETVQLSHTLTMMNWLAYGSNSNTLLQKIWETFWVSHRCILVFWLSHDAIMWVFVERFCCIGIPLKSITVH